MGSRSSVRDCVLVASLALGALGLRSGVQAAALDGAAEQRVRSATLEVVAENGGFPFNSTAFTNNGTSIIRAIAKGTPGDAKVRYALTVVGEGNVPQGAMRKHLGMLQRSFKPLEH